jgi:hypothetical protein
LKEYEGLGTAIVSSDGLFVDRVHRIAPFWEGDVSNLAKLVGAFASEVGVVDDAPGAIEEFDRVGIAFGECK